MEAGQSAKLVETMLFGSPNDFLKKDRRSFVSDMLDPRGHIKHDEQVSDTLEQPSGDMPSPPGTRSQIACSMVALFDGL